MALTGHQEATERLLIEEADAWFEYLEVTRGQSALRYVEVEPWAWSRLAATKPSIGPPATGKKRISCSGGGSGSTATTRSSSTLLVFSVRSLARMRANRWVGRGIVG